MRGERRALDAPLQLQHLHTAASISNCLTAGLLPACMLGASAAAAAHHPVVHLNSNHPPRPLQQLHGQVARARADLQHDIRGLDACLVDDGLDHQGVLQDVLPLALQELDAWCTQSGLVTCNLSRRLCAWSKNWLPT